MSSTRQTVGVFDNPVIPVCRESRRFSVGAKPTRPSVAWPKATRAIRGSVSSTHIVIWDSDLTTLFRALATIVSATAGRQPKGP